MIELPHRSVTRFFVPLIDVLTLLFCIFLVMPLATDAPPPSTQGDAQAVEQRLQVAQEENRVAQEENRSLQQRLKQAQEENKRLHNREEADVVKKVSVGILDMRVADKKPLLYHATSDRPLRSKEDVRRMIEDDKGLSGGNPWVYVIRYPTPPPTDFQRRQVFSWFDGLAPVNVEGRVNQ